MVVGVWHVVMCLVQLEALEMGRRQVGLYARSLARLGRALDLRYRIDRHSQTEAFSIHQAQRHHLPCDGLLKGVTISEVSLATVLS